MNEKKQNILKSTALVAGIVLLGKVLGLLRETLVAALYGATAETDAFFFAQSMPGTLFPAVCNSLSTAFISLYVLRLTEDGEEPGDQYASRILVSTTVLGIILSIVGILITPVAVPLLAPGFKGTQLTLAVFLSRITMGAFVLMMLQYMLTAILNSKQFFVGSQVASLFYNVTIIALLFLLGAHQGIVLLTVSTVLAIFIQILVLAVCCRGHFHFTLRQKHSWAENRHLLRLSLPILLGNSVVQLHLIVDKALGSLLSEGSLSALTYGNTLGNLVVNVLVVSLTTVLYPNLTADAASGNTHHYGKVLLRSMSGLTALMMPIVCVTMLYAGDIVRIVYGRGSFSEEAVANTAQVLVCYAPMFVACAVREVLTRGYFAIQDTRTPMLNSAFSVGGNIVLSLLLTPRWGIVGITLGTTISTLLAAVLLLRSIRRKMPELELRIFPRNLFHQIIAGAVSFLALWEFRELVPLSGSLFRFSAATVLCFLIYGGCLLLLNHRKIVCD